MVIIPVLYLKFVPHTLRIHPLVVYEFAHDTLLELNVIQDAVVLNNLENDAFVAFIVVRDAVPDKHVNVDMLSLLHDKFIILAFRIDALYAVK